MAPLDDLKKAKEESYFDKKNKEALERLAQKNKGAEKPKLSPITGEPMVQQVIHGVVIDRCPTSGGIWLDAGELEQLMEAAQKEKKSEGWLSNFLKALKDSKP
jgi:hypothetical protein